MLKYENLLVSGCSFTFNKGWAEYTKNKFKFKKLINLAKSGAGNQHIADSVVHKLETDTDLTPSNTYVIVMWSGADRLDTMIDIKHKLPTYQGGDFYYTDSVISGGSHGQNQTGNVNKDVFKLLYDVKNQDILSLQTWIHITNTYHYLRSRGYANTFLQFRNQKIPALDHSFDWQSKLPEHVDITYMFAKCITPYEHALQKDSFIDNYHPTEQVFHDWCDKHLHPEIHHDLVN